VLIIGDWLSIKSNHPLSSIPYESALAPEKAVKSMSNPWQYSIASVCGTVTLRFLLKCGLKQAFIQDGHPGKKWIAVPSSGRSRI
jgi:hypothetical protein